MIEMNASIHIAVRLVTDEEGGSAVFVDMLGAQVDGALARKVNINSLYEFSGEASLSWGGGEVAGAGRGNHEGRIVGQAKLHVDVDPPSILRHLPKALLTMTGACTCPVQNEQEVLPACPPDPRLPGPPVPKECMLHAQWIDR
jgi:hypothetical protein